MLPFSSDSDICGGGVVVVLIVVVIAVIIGDYGRGLVAVVVLVAGVVSVAVVF